jgi:hypothetical protein
MSELREVVTGFLPTVKENKQGIEQFKAPEKTKEERLRDFIKSMATIDESIKPFREQKTDLKKSYADNNYLSRSEQKIAMKAYRLIKDKTDFAQLDQFFDKIKAMKLVDEE